MLSIADLVLGIVIHNPDLSQVVVFIDALLMLILAVDLFRRLRVADHDRACFFGHYGWLDLISIIPALRKARMTPSERWSRPTTAPSRHARARCRTRRGARSYIKSVPLRIVNYETTDPGRWTRHESKRSSASAYIGYSGARS